LAVLRLAEPATKSGQRQNFDWGQGRKGGGSSWRSGQIMVMVSVSKKILQKEGVHTPCRRCIQLLPQNMPKDNTSQKRKTTRALTPGVAKPSQRHQHREATLAKWHAMDWSKSNVELADELGSAASHISYMRRRIGAPQSPRFHKTRAKLKEPRLAKWRSWDWSKRNVVLAGETGLSRERIRQIREMLGVPKGPPKGRNSARRRRKTRALKRAARGRF
jgi:hypothetical protein